MFSDLFVATMSLFDNLPQETLRRIFELIRVEWDPDNLSYKLIGVGKSAETLAQLALVSKSWRVEAQGVLFKVVYLSSKERLEQFIKSPALTRYKVRALTLHGSDVEKQRINPTQVAQALNKIKGLRSLEISSIKGQNAGLLVHPSLTGRRGRCGVRNETGKTH